MIKSVLFDLDGTILDTNELIIQSFLHALDGVTADPLTREVVIQHMGRSLTEQMQLFSGQEDVQELILRYRQYNVSRHDEMVREFPGVKQTLAALRQRGMRLAVVTSKIRMTTEMGLKLCGLYDFMDTIITVDDVTMPKPEPEGIRKALTTLGAEPGQAIMVGDSQYDIEAARNAGVVSVGVAWSLKGEAYLRKFYPDFVIREMAELLDVVDRADQMRSGADGKRD